MSDDHCSCGARFREHAEDSDCPYVKWARDLVGRAMDKVFFPEGVPGE